MENENVIPRETIKFFLKVGNPVIIAPDKTSVVNIETENVEFYIPKVELIQSLLCYVTKVYADIVNIKIPTKDISKMQIYRTLS